MVTRTTMKTLSGAFVRAALMRETLNGLAVFVGATPLDVPLPNAKSTEKNSSIPWRITY